MATNNEVLKRFEDPRHDAIIADTDPGISTPRHRQRVRSAEVRGNRLALLAVVGTVGAVVLIPSAVKAVSSLAPARFSCDPSTTQQLYSGPNAFSIAARLNPSDWKNVPLRQNIGAEPIAAANMAYTFDGSAFGPEKCQ